MTAAGILARGKLGQPSENGTTVYPGQAGTLYSRGQYWHMHNINIYTSKYVTTVSDPMSTARRAM